MKLFEWLLTSLTATTVKQFAVRVGLFLAIKAVITTLFMLALPLLIFKAWFIIQTYVLEFVQTKIDFTSFFSSATTVDLTGVGAYLADHLQLSQGVSVVLSAVVLSFVISFIRK